VHVTDNPLGLDRNGGTDGPPAGGVGDAPGAQNIPIDQLRPTIDKRAGDSGRVNFQDPGFAAPGKPLVGSETRAQIIYRDIPLVSMTTTWTPRQVVNALASHVIGIFNESAQLADSILADPRVQATLNSRMSGLFGRGVRHRPADKSRAAREVFDAWVDHWPKLYTSSFVEMHTYQILMGFGDGQLVWDDSGPVALPYLRFWHPRYEFYQWDIRHYIAISQDGPKVVYPGDGKWVHHTPKGDYRGWMWGAIRAVAEPVLLRHYGFRDMARFSEVHGMPIRIGKVPAVADETQRQRFQSQLANLGTETTMILPQGVTNDTPGYEVELVEAESTTWEIFPSEIDRCDMDIVLALIFQNLTTEVSGGSLAATKSHMDILQFGIENDNIGWRDTIHNQIARAFAYINFGDADLAPWTDWDVTRREDYQTKAATFYSFGQSVQILRQGGVKFADPDDLRAFARTSFGVELPDTIEITEPVGPSGAKETGDAQGEKQGGKPPTG
jgi:phage gp29-like protein